MNRNCLQSAVSHYETPFYVYDLDLLEKNAKKIMGLLNSKIGLCFAMKANPFLTKTMCQWADRIEVCSMGEFYICQKLDIKPEKLFISGVLKKEKDLIEILDTCGSRCIYTAESFNQLQCLARWGELHKEKISVFLRLSNGTQFGMDEEEIKKIMGNQNEWPYIKIAGIHYFTGTQKKNIKKIKQEIQFLDDFVKNLEVRLNTVIEQLEYGPGIPVAYFDGQEDDMYVYFKEISEAVRGMQWKGKIVLEMGRAFCALCGYYVTRIEDVKYSDGKNYCIVDGGIHQLHYDGQIRGMYLPKMYSLWEDQESIEKTWTVCGSLCTFNDILANAFIAGNLKVGDILVFERTGAYSSMEGMSLFLSHELPRVFLYSQRYGWQLVRDEIQTYEWNMTCVK